MLNKGHYMKLRTRSGERKSVVKFMNAYRRIRFIRKYIQIQNARQAAQRAQ